MNIPKIADAIGYIDNELITATLEAPPKKRHNPVMKWMTAAACLTLFVIAGILIPHLFRMTQQLKANINIMFLKQNEP